MRLLVTGAFKATKEQLNQIESLGHEIIFMQNEQGELPCDAKEIEGTICNGLFLYHPIEDFVNLKYIQLTSAGLDRVPMEYVNEHKIEIYNARGVYSIPMAEFAISGVLQLLKKSRFFYDNQKKHIWEKNRELQELTNKKVLIVGCGSVGFECAKRFKAFDCEIIGIDPYVNKGDYFDSIYAMDELDKQLELTDIVVLTLPLIDDTKHLFSKDELLKIKEGSILVNIARGAIIDTNALIEVVDHFGGLVLDVFEDEPLSEDSPLWSYDKVIITPHNSFVGENNNERLFNVIKNNL